MRRAATIALLGLCTAACGSGAKQTATTSSSPPRPRPPAFAGAVARTLAEQTARLDQTTTIVVGGAEIKAHDSGTIAFDASRAHLYKLEPGTSVPGEVIVVGPITYTNANVQAALNSPGVRPWTKLDTRKLPARIRRSRPDELAHVVAPVFLASGARKVSLARTVADGAVYWARIDPALVVRRVPAAERTIVSTALRGDYPRTQFNAKFWLDAHGRIRRVIVAYATSRGTPVSIDTSYSGFGVRVAVKPPPANRVTDITPR